MKKIITDNIATPVKQPFTKYSLDHLQSAYTELLDGLAQSNSIGGELDGKAHVIYGCTTTHTTGTFWQIQNGMIYNGMELYKVPTSFIDVIPPLVPVFYIKTSFIANDPVLLSDGSFENVHEINEIYITGGTSGFGGSSDPSLTYLCDYSALTQAPVFLPEATFIEEDWTYVTDGMMENGWTNYSITNEVPFRFKKDNQGYLIIEGSVSSPYPFTGSTIYTLTGNYVPTYRHNIVLWASPSGSNPAYITISETGAINIAFNNSGVNHYYLNVRIKLD